MFEASLATCQPLFTLHLIPRNEIWYSVARRFRKNLTLDPWKSYPVVNNPTLPINICEISKNCTNFAFFRQFAVLYKNRIYSMRNLTAQTDNWCLTDDDVISDVNDVIGVTLDFHCTHTRVAHAHRYDRTTRPVRDDSTTITVNVAISLYHILDTVSGWCFVTSSDTGRCTCMCVTSHRVQQRRAAAAASERVSWYTSD